MFIFGFKLAVRVPFSILVSNLDLLLLLVLLILVLGHLSIWKSKSSPNENCFHLPKSLN